VLGQRFLARRGGIQEDKTQKDEARRASGMFSHIAHEDPWKRENW
jgi:hypothetical protein